MAEHENCIGESDEWYTPQEIFDAMNVTFDLDPCSDGDDSIVPANKKYTKADDGLSKEWDGFVFMNPPFGGRNGHVPWVRNFLKHNNGVAIVRAYTSAGWFHDYATGVDAVLFPRGKTKFVRPDGSIGKSPGHGIVLLALGDQAVNALINANEFGLGWFINFKY